MAAAQLSSLGAPPPCCRASFDEGVANLSRKRLILGNDAKLRKCPTCRSSGAVTLAKHVRAYLEVASTAHGIASAMCAMQEPLARFQTAHPPPAHTGFAVWDDGEQSFATDDDTSESECSWGSVDDDDESADDSEEHSEPQW